jgi:glyoxylase-like metal-dependent hydrolase (beta-lactamase superfamily II)
MAPFILQLYEFASGCSIDTMHSRATLILAAAALFASVLAGQNPPPPAPGADLSGMYTPDRNLDPGLGTAAGMLVDYGGIPINEASRLYALAWDASRITVRQQQCAGYVPPYMFVAPGNYRIFEDRDPYTQQLKSISVYGQIAEGHHEIFMDGRPHPPAYAAHTFPGFSTGKFEGSILTVETSHIKRGWIRAPGVAQSDEATVREHFIRHGDRITIFSVTTDPVYLAEPFAKVQVLLRYANDPNGWLYACDDGEQILDKGEDRVPAYPPGGNPFLKEYSEKQHVPLLGALGGPETTRPEFAARLRTATDSEALAETRPSNSPRQVSQAKDPDPHDGEIHVWPVQGNVYMLVGDGANMAVQIGPQGAFVVDSGAGQLSDKAIAAIARLTPRRIQFVVNTSFHADHTGGNVKLSAAGQDPSLFGSFFSNNVPSAGTTATLIAHQNLQNRMVAAAASDRIPEAGWPSDTFLRDRRRKFHNEEGVEIFWQPNASTDGDSIVHFRRSDVLVTGDIFDTTRYPFIDVKNGGSVQGEIQALNFMLNRTLYEHDEDNGTMIIPGHGRVSNEFELAEYRDMIVIIRDRIQAMINRNATLEEVKAARPTIDYDTRFGSGTGPWTTDLFIEAIYTSLKRPPAIRN